MRRRRLRHLIELPPGRYSSVLVARVARPEGSVRRIWLICLRSALIASYADVSFAAGSADSRACSPLSGSPSRIGGTGSLRSCGRSFFGPLAVTF